MKKQKALIITDLEGVNGVLNFPDWCMPGGFRNEAACRFLTEEVNAVVRGFFDGGFSEVTVWDGHGSGGSIRGEILDDRAALQRGIVHWPSFGPEYDALAFVGQHAKAGSKKAHLAHTQTEEAIDFRLNSLSIGEYGQLAFAAADNGTTTIFCSGDSAMAKEAAELTPEVVTVAVKEGLADAPGAEETKTDRVFEKQSAAIHFPRKKILERLYKKSLEAAEKFLKNPKAFALPKLKKPFTAEAEYRATGKMVSALFGNLPPRFIKTRPRPTATEALHEFYAEIEWLMPDSDRVTELKLK